jgi:Xaa-Pro aminopeptidase
VPDRLQKLRQTFVEYKVDAILISQAENRRYLSGFDGSAGYLLITGNKAVLATDFRYIEQAKNEAPDFEILRITGKISDWLPGLVIEAGIKKLGFESGDVSYAFFRQIADAVKDNKISLELVPINGMVEGLRAVKEPEEIERISRAAAITDAAFEYVEEHISPGMTENQVAWELEKCLRENGSHGLAFEIIVASGPRAALPHAKPTDRVIEEGEPVVIDMGGRYEGYAGDLTRTICIGNPDEKFKDIYQTVLDAQRAALAIINEGMTGQQADTIARDVIKKAGHGEEFGHSLGHGVGLAAHELPHLGPGSGDILTEGMIFSVEPGIYIPGWGGVRIEDIVVMEHGKARVLSQARKVKYD